MLYTAFFPRSLILIAFAKSVLWNLDIATSP